MAVQGTHIWHIGNSQNATPSTRFILVNLPEPASFGFRHGIFAMMQITFHSSSGIVFCEMGDLQDDTDGLVEVFDLHVPDLQGAR